MNILPKKSWHVLSRKNIQRVREDEAAAKRAEEEKSRRAALAEQESKIIFMRKRQRALEGEEDDGAEGEEKGRSEKPKKGKEEVKIIAPDGHINFFSDLQTGVGADKANPEHIAEKKAEQEKFEKKIGLLTYLVDKDSSSSDPWYTKSSNHEQSIAQGKRKAAADPLNDMMMYVKAKKKSAKDTGTQPPVSSVKSKSSPLASSSSHHHSSHKKHKHKDSKKKDLDKLREERRRREEAEKTKSEALLKRHYGLEPDPVAVQEQPQRYNSQFNPHLARVRR